MGGVAVILVQVMLPALCKRALSLDLKERTGAVHMAAEAPTRSE